MHKSLKCFAHGGWGSWEAICVDLDIAVQGRSLEEVKGTLREAIAGYVHDAAQEAPEVRDRLLKRRVPWHVKAVATFSPAYRVQAPF